MDFENLLKMNCPYFKFDFILSNFKKKKLMTIKGSIR